MASAIEKDVSINKYKLDEEAKNLPSLICKYHTQINEKTTELTSLEFDLEKEEAVAKKDVRDAFIAEGKKPTIDMVNGEVSVMSSIQHLRRKIADLKTEIVYLKGVLDALDAKRSSLNNLVSLYIKDYYSQKDDGSYKEADVKHSFSKEYDDMADFQMESVRNLKLKRR